MRELRDKFYDIYQKLCEKAPSYDTPSNDLSPVSKPGAQLPDTDMQRLREIQAKKNADANEEYIDKIVNTPTQRTLPTADKALREFTHQIPPHVIAPPRPTPQRQPITGPQQPVRQPITGPQQPIRQPITGPQKPIPSSQCALPLSDIRAKSTPLNLVGGVICKYMDEHNGTFPTVVFIHHERVEAMTRDFHKRYPYLTYGNEFYFGYAPGRAKTIAVLTDLEMPDHLKHIFKPFPADGAVAVSMPK